MKTILVIDPSAHATEGKGFSWLELLRTDCSLGDFRYERYSPVWQNQNLRQAMEGVDCAGVIVLGSSCNVTDGHPWVEVLRRELEPLLFQHQLPVFGICFGHQFLSYLCGAKVDYIYSKTTYSEKYHRCIRRVGILHPKLALLNATMIASDYGSKNARDLEFCWALNYSDALQRQDWEALMVEVWPEQRCASSHEARFRRFLSTSVEWSFVARVSHEQEVVALNDSPLVLAASSLQCDFDGFVHPELPIFSVQSHPETAIFLPDGWRILRNFLYYCLMR